MRCSTPRFAHLVLAGTVLGLTLAPASGQAPDEPRRWTFDDMTPGSPPSGFDFATTLDAPGGRWEVRADGQDRGIAHVDSEAIDRRFAMAVARDVQARDLRLSVRGKPIGGTADQAVGLVWRWQDKDNYYVTRTNVLERNVRIYRVVNGNRIKFASVEDVDLPAEQWQTLTVEHAGAKIRILLDGRELLHAEDRTFEGPGRVGLWVKADSITLFDDLTLEVRDPK